jgi:hypothetical protein
MPPGPAVGNAREHYNVCAAEIDRNVPRQFTARSPSVAQARRSMACFGKRQNMANSFAIPATDIKPQFLLTRAETLATLRIGDTTLHRLARTKKLSPIKIGARVLFNATEVERLARRGCSLTEADKRAATRPPPVSAGRGDPGRREDRPSTPAGEIHKKRSLDTGCV